jgi:hypothetical protein
MDFNSALGSGWQITEEQGSITVVGIASTSGITGTTQIGTISGIMTGSGVATITNIALGKLNPDGSSTTISGVSGISGSVTETSAGGGSGGGGGGGGGAPSTGGSGGSGGTAVTTTTSPAYISPEERTGGHYEPSPTPVAQPTVGVETPEPEARGFIGNAFAALFTEGSLGWIILIIVLALIFGVLWFATGKKKQAKA